MTWFNAKQNLNTGRSLVQEVAMTFHIFLFFFWCFFGLLSLILLRFSLHNNFSWWWRRCFYVSVRCSGFALPVFCLTGVSVCKGCKPMTQQENAGKFKSSPRQRNGQKQKYTWIFQVCEKSAFFTKRTYQRQKIIFGRSRSYFYIILIYIYIYYINISIYT